MSDTNPSEPKAACDFRDYLLPKADGSDHGVYPWWHGWALVEAFHAGAKWQREQERKDGEK